MKSKRKNKGDSASENRHMGGVRSPPLCFLGDYIITPPKQTSVSKDYSVTPPKCATMPTAWQPDIDTRKGVLLTPSSVRDVVENTSQPHVMSAEDLKCQKVKKQSYKEQIQTVLADQLKVNSQDKLDVLAKIYSECITGKLVSYIDTVVFSIWWLGGSGEGQKMGRLMPPLKNSAQKIIWNSKEFGSQRLCEANQFQMQKMMLIKFVLETWNIEFLLWVPSCYVAFLQLIWF